MPLEFIHKGKSAKHLIILVHGFTGNSKTFHNSGKKCIYSYLSQNIRDTCDFAIYSYSSGWIDKIPGFIYMIPWVRRILGSGNTELDKYASLLRTYYGNLSKRYVTVSFICHSMGGLIAKKVVIGLLADGIPFPGFYITLATPHRGIEAAIRGARLHRHINELRPHSNIVINTSQDWVKCSLKIRRCYFSAIHDEIVSEISACPQGEESLHFRVEGDHITICKPVDTEDIVATTLSGKITDFLKLKGDAVPAQDPTVDPLFISYDSANECYYFVRNVDRQLMPTVKMRNIWISGPAGCGKTNVVQYLASKQTSMRVYVDVSASSGKAEGMLLSVLDSLRFQLEHTQPEHLSQVPIGTMPAIMKLLELLRNQETVLLIVDEVGGTDPEEFRSFVDDMIAICRVQGKVACSHAVRLAICTIGSPIEYLGTEQRDSLKEHFELTLMQYWTASEILQLCELVQAGLKCVLSKTEEARLLEYSKGSPRRLKSIMRQGHARATSLQGLSIQRALDDVLTTEGVR